MRSWPRNSPYHHPLLFPILLVAVITAVYYQAMIGGIHPIDDPGIISLYSSSPPLSQILLPGHSYYYRPLIELSYWLDNRLWGMDPGIMHLENIFLHCINTLLVYQLFRKMLSSTDEIDLILPFMAALLFAVHPANVEAVVWIAGRTDPLLAIFVLSALIFWLCWLENARWQNMAMSLVMFGAALLTKETAVVVGVVAFLLMLVWPGVVTLRRRLAVIGAVLALSLLLLSITLFFRSGFSGLVRLISGSELHAGQAVWDVLTAIGFYAKKLILPIPLNFAITKVSSLYGIAGLMLLLALGWGLRFRSMIAVLLASSTLLVVPAVAVALKQISWTPYAERYLYLPSAFCVMGLVVSVQSIRKQFKDPVIVFLLFVSMVFAVISWHRTVLWNDKLAFIQDAVAKSPGFGSLYNELGGILLQHGDVDGATAAFLKADSLNMRPSMTLLIKTNLLIVQNAKGNYQAVREQFFQLFKDKKEATPDLLEQLYQADSKRLYVLSGKEQIDLATDLLETIELLNKKKPDPFLLYRSGQISMVVGNNAAATDFFRRAYSAAPPDAHYRRAARTYIQKLERLK